LRYVRREQPLRDNLLVCGAAFGALGFGTHDVLIRMGVLPFDQPYASPYLIPLLMSALCWLVAGDYARSQQRLSNAHRELAERLAQRERELQVSFQQLAQIERDRATTAERRRILRDMHDGVGAHITTAMRQLEGGRTEPELVAQTLRDSLDQLKLSIDAMNLPPGDVNALLASLRYRLQRRIESAGLVLHWAVDRLPLWPAGQADTAAMRHLQFIVFEGISNALQHACATEMTLGATTLEAGATGTAICITLSDNGCGLSGDPAVALHTMRERARMVSADLQVDLTAPGTCVVLTLPVRGLAVATTTAAIDRV
jgi:signal transduction histidine kinase